MGEDTSKRRLECCCVCVCVYMRLSAALCFAADSHLSILAGTLKRFRCRQECLLLPSELNNCSIGAGRGEKRIPVSCSERVRANPLLWFLSFVAVAFHSPPVTIKKEPQSPGSDPNQSCSHKQSFSYPGGEQCLYARYLRGDFLSVPAAPTHRLVDLPSASLSTSCDTTTLSNKSAVSTDPTLVSCHVSSAKTH